MTDEHLPGETPGAPTDAHADTGGDAEYGQDSVDVLRDYKHIRQHPGVYIGELGQKGVHHLVYELVSNSVDEALAGYCTDVFVRINADGSLSVSDNGRGIPTEEHSTEKVSTLQVVMTVVGAGGKFRKGSYKVSAGLHGMGAKAVTALSEWSEAVVQRGGRMHRQEYERGQPVTAVQDIGASKLTGTRVTFKPDVDIFGEVAFNFETLEERLRELAFLNKGLALHLHDERDKREVSFKFQDGLLEFIKHLNRNEDPLHPVILIDKSQENVRVEVALQYAAGDANLVRCYTNNAYNVNGGPHLSGFWRALSRAIGNYGTKQELFKKITPEGEDFREGLAAVVAIQMPEPRFDSQEKRKLLNVEADGVVNTIVYESLTKWMEEHPKDAQRICKKAEIAAEAREAAAKARKASKDRKGILSGGGLPGKLFDCSTRDRDASELFLVEGDSAGGSAVGGRDNNYQAILPLRGKLINVEKARMEAMLDNREITSLISAIGIDIGIGLEPLEGEEDGLKKLRYGKVIILTDADVDGQHIRTLLLTFFYRQMPQLVVRGHIYVARPPLFKVTLRKGSKQTVRFVPTLEAMAKELNERGLKDTRLRILPLPGEGGSERDIESDRMAGLVEVMTHLEKSLSALERSGVMLIPLIARLSVRGLPSYRVTIASHDEWFFTPEEQSAYMQAHEKEGYSVAAEDTTLAAAIGEPVANGATTNGTVSGPAKVMYHQDFHEVRNVNKRLPELEKMGLLPRDLIPQPRLAGREPPPHLILECDGNPHTLAHLRDLIVDIRKLGERGLTITRFKGLGEMDPAELWETTLDPAVRTLLQVRLDDAARANELFRTLMGDKVEPRRDFIRENAMKVKDLDAHGA